MKKIIFIVLAILFIILLTNRVDTEAPLDIKENLESVIGCMDYSYEYELNVPAKLSFYVTEPNEEDSLGPFKTVDVNAGETKGSTILHCGNSYILIVSAPGYKEYTEQIEGKHFRPIIPEVHKIKLEKS